MRPPLIALLAIFGLLSVQAMSARDAQSSIDQVFVRDTPNVGYGVSNLTTHAISIKKVTYTTAKHGDFIGFQLTIDGKPAMNKVFYESLQDATIERVLARAKQTPSLLTDMDTIEFRSAIVLRSHSRFGTVVEATITLGAESYRTRFDDLDGMLAVFVNDEKVD